LLGAELSLLDALARLTAVLAHTHPLQAYGEAGLHLLFRQEWRLLRRAAAAHRLRGRGRCQFESPR